jgi:hypothetical protein
MKTKIVLPLIIIVLILVALIFIGITDEVMKVKFDDETPLLVDGITTDITLPIEIDNRVDLISRDNKKFYVKIEDSDFIGDYGKLIIEEGDYVKLISYETFSGNSYIQMKIYESEIIKKVQK